MPCERPLQSSQSPQNLVHATEGGALIASEFTARVGRAGGARTRGLVSSGRTLVECRRSEQFVSISVADLFVGRRSAGRPGLDFASVGQASGSGSGRTWRTNRPVDSARRHPDYLEAETALGQLSHAVSVLVTLCKLVATPPPTARHERLPIHRAMERRFWAMARARTRFARRAGGPVKPPSRMCSGALIRILSFSRSRRNCSS
jgi:hypothetical protein